MLALCFVLHQKLAFNQIKVDQRIFVYLHDPYEILVLLTLLTYKQLLFTPLFIYRYPRRADHTYMASKHIITTCQNERE